MDTKLTKYNCWEYMKCGREPGGINVKELGVCPASTETKVDGFNQGINGGRACWAIVGTLCKGEVVGKLASKLVDCAECDFFSLVIDQQGPDYQGASEILKALQD